jgi:hypothetical protein
MNDLRTRPIRLSCQEWTLGGCRVPAFQVRAGEIVRIQFPNLQEVPRKDFREALCEANGRGLVQSTGKVVAAEFPFARSWWQELLHRQRAGEWFQGQTGLSLADSRRYLERVGLRIEARLCELAGTPLKLLAIQAAYALNCDVLVFDTDGLDPLGMRDALNAVVSQLGNSAAVYLAAGHFPFEPEVSYTSIVDAHWDPTQSATRMQTCRENHSAPQS